jgi:hypothetical protein
MVRGANEVPITGGQTEGSGRRLYLNVERARARQ